MPTMDPGALRAALERQDHELVPIARVLAAVAATPPRFSASDWRGETAEACLRLQEELRRALREGDQALASAARSTRGALTELGG